MLYGKIAIDLEDDVIVFMHTPKTGGWSFIRLMERNWGENAHLRLGMSKAEKTYRSRFHETHWRLKSALSWVKGKLTGIHPMLYRRLSEDDKRRIRFMSGHFAWGHAPDLGKRPALVSIVREPIRRFISDYYFSQSGQGAWRRTGGLHDPRKRALAEMDISEYARWLARPENRNLHNIQCRYVSGKPDFEYTRELIDEHYYCCAPLERIADFVILLSRPFQFHDTGIGHNNPGREIPDGLVLDDDTHGILRDVFSEDVLMYQYVCGEFERIWSENA